MALLRHVGIFPGRGLGPVERCSALGVNPLAWRVSTGGTEIVGADSLNDQKPGAASIATGHPVRGHRRHCATLADIEQVARRRGASLDRQHTLQTVEGVGNPAVVVPGHLLPRCEGQDADPQVVGLGDHLAVLDDVGPGFGICHRCVEPPFELPPVAKAGLGPSRLSPERTMPNRHPDESYESPPRPSKPAVPQARNQLPIAGVHDRVVDFGHPGADKDSHRTTSGRDRPE